MCPSAPGTLHFPRHHPRPRPHSHPGPRLLALLPSLSRAPGITRQLLTSPTQGSSSSPTGQLIVSILTSLQSLCSNLTHPSPVSQRAFPSNTPVSVVGLPQEPRGLLAPLLNGASHQMSVSSCPTVTTSHGGCAGHESRFLCAAFPAVGNPGSAGSDLTNYPLRHRGPPSLGLYHQTRLVSASELPCASADGEISPFSLPSTHNPSGAFPSYPGCLCRFVLGCLGAKLSFIHWSHIIIIMRISCLYTLPSCP